MRNGRYGGKRGHCLFTGCKGSADNSRAPQSMECTANVSQVTSPPAGRWQLPHGCEPCERCHSLKIPPLYKVENMFVCMAKCLVHMPCNLGICGSNPPGSSATCHNDIKHTNHKTTVGILVFNASKWQQKYFSFEKIPSCHYFIGSMLLVQLADQM